MFLFEIVLLGAAIFALNFELCFCPCARSEYEIKGECCPMCPAGNRVYRHCTEDSSTTCVPCLESTYIDHPNGLIQCLSCSVCDAGKGLRVRKSCTSTADVLCEPQEGFYCIDKNKYTCTLAVKHIECRPGQYIKQAGTAYTDTTCANCPDGFYSNGTLLACKPHSKCNVTGGIEIKAGTTSTDAECFEFSPCVLLIAVFMVLLICSAGSPENKCVSYVAQPQNDLEPEYMSSEEEHTSCEEEHTSSEEEHTSSEEEHTSSEEEHSSSEEELHVQRGGAHVQRGGAHVQRGGAHVQRGGAHVQRGGAQVQRGGAHVQRGGAHVQRGGAQVQRGGAHVQRGGAHVQRGGAHVQRGGAHVQREGAHLQRGGAHVQRGGAHVQRGGAHVQRGGATCPASRSTCSGCPANGSTCPSRRGNIAAFTF